MLMRLVPSFLGEIKNASHRETHFCRFRGADAPAAPASDNHRTFRETRPSPIVAKIGFSRFLGYAPPSLQQAPADFGSQGPRRPPQRAARLVLALTDKGRWCKIRGAGGIPRIVPPDYRLPYCRLLLPRLAVCSCWRGWMPRSTVSPMFRAVCRMKSRDLPRSSGA